MNLAAFLGLRKSDRGQTTQQMSSSSNSFHPDSRTTTSPSGPRSTMSFSNRSPRDRGFATQQNLPSRIPSVRGSQAQQERRSGSSTTRFWASDPFVGAAPAEGLGPEHYIPEQQHQLSPPRAAAATVANGSVRTQDTSYPGQAPSRAYTGGTLTAPQPMMTTPSVMFPLASQQTSPSRILPTTSFAVPVAVPTAAQVQRSMTRQIQSAEMTALAQLEQTLVAMQEFQQRAELSLHEKLADQEERLATLQQYWQREAGSALVEQLREHSQQMQQDIEDRVSSNNTHLELLLRDVVTSIVAQQKLSMSTGSGSKPTRVTKMADSSSVGNDQERRAAGTPSLVDAATSPVDDRAAVTQQLEQERNVRSGVPDNFGRKPSTRQSGSGQLQQLLTPKTVTASPYPPKTLLLQAEDGETGKFLLFGDVHMRFSLSCF